MTQLQRARAFIQNLAAGYEPVAAAQLVAAIFTAAAGLGLVLGDLPQQVDAILGFLAVAAPLVAGKVGRDRVVPQATLSDHVEEYNEETGEALVKLPAEIAVREPKAA